MKFAWWSLCILIGVAGFTATPPQQPDVTLVFTGDISGYLSPCGCTKPQIGGMKRAAGVIRALTKQPNTYYVDIGNFSKPGGRQEQLKAEAIAEFYRNVNASIVNIGKQDLLLGESFLQSLNDVSGGKLSSASTSYSWLPRAWAFGQLLIVGITEPNAEAVASVTVPNTVQVVLLSSDRDGARRIAESTNATLVIYSQHGDPSQSIEQVGNAALVSVGDHGRYVGKIELRDGKWTNFSLIQLGPEHVDDMAASRIYTSYLKRVTDENLIAEVPRANDGKKYIGSKNCLPCHGKTYAHWKMTKHSHALPTLEATGNDKDPECVGCHVIALEHITGFRDKKSTPALANVGCESCHGAGYKHAKNPRIVKMGKVGEKSCAPCHTLENSPTFNFAEYWKKIKHK